VKSDRLILVVLAGLGVIAAFWFGLLSPKRSELAKLDEERTSLQASVSAQEQLAASAEEAEASYADNFGGRVSIGKAVPTDDDTASLVVQTSKLAKDAKIAFQSLTLASSGGEPAAEPAPAETSTETEGAEASESAQPVAAPATEASAATLPLGATVGPAGLPVMPYDLTFRGEFFAIADFMRELDSLVRVSADGLEVRGRLLTVDGFNLAADEVRGFPHLVANMHVTSFVTPADQGATGGATPEGPPSTLSAAPVPVSAP
jgi:Tfp pilus assembly protein PilO